MDDVLQLYEAAPWLTRTFLRGRVLLSDLEAIERQVPVNGTIVELGCGHGIFSNLLALRSPGRQVTGIDLSPGKIDLALKTMAGRDNIHFISADIAEMEIPECDAIAIVDFLYLLPRGEQQRVLAACRRRVRPDGLLVWKAQERRPRWKYAWTYLQELFMTSAGITRGRRERLAFMSREEAVEALEEAGFAASVVEMNSWRPYPDVLYLGRPAPNPCS